MNHPVYKTYLYQKRASTMYQIQGRLRMRTLGQNSSAKRKIFKINQFIMPSWFSRSANDHYESTNKVDYIAKRFVKNVLLYKHTLYRSSIKYIHVCRIVNKTRFARNVRSLFSTKFPLPVLIKLHEHLVTKFNFSIVRFFASCPTFRSAPETNKTFGATK